ncbi:hypothetical protein [Burkholderia sp. S-53]|nr:hypothetical protein [Burkholderia sp. S-53]
MADVEVVPVAAMLAPEDDPASSPPHADKPVAAKTKHIINIPK